MNNSWIDFFLLTDLNVRYVVLGSVLLAASSAVVGVFTFLQKRSLAGDAVSHAILPGVCLAFLLSGNKNPFYLLIGASFTAWLALLSIDLITEKTKTKEDTAIGLVLSVFFGVGILLLTYLQHASVGEQSGLDSFLFGKAAALMEQDLWIFGGVAVLVLVTVLALFKEFALLTFDPQFAKIIGLPVRGLEWLLTMLTILAVVVGIQAVGVVLMSAMLISPPAAARFWTDRLWVMVVLSALIAAVAAYLGVWVSYVSPAMPTGPWIVLCISLVALLSFLTAPKKGLLAKWWQQRRYKRKFAEENVLKLMYQLGEKNKNFFEFRNEMTLLENRNFGKKSLKKILSRLVTQGYLNKTTEAWAFTQEGFERGKRIVKLHRLWELYLTESVKLPPDHVHDDAETMEHIISPEIEKLLEQRLQHPKYDPHKSEIPYH